LLDGNFFIICSIYKSCWSWKNTLIQNKKYEKYPNRTAIVTGSSYGLGSQIARSLVMSGFNLVINYSKQKSTALKLEKELSKIGQVMVLKGDVSKFTDVKNVVNKTIKQFGRIDVLVNNAGIHIDKTVYHMSQKSWKKVIDTNLNGVFNFCKVVLPKMKNQAYGRIINISSFAAFKGIAGASNYTASKAGVIGLTKSLAKEVAKYGITVNAIAPGYLDIGMFNDLNEELKNKIKNDLPAKRLGRPEEVSDIIKILISSNYLTGQVFILDGGYSA